MNMNQSIKIGDEVEMPDGEENDIWQFPFRATFDMYLNSTDTLTFINIILGMLWSYGLYYLMRL